jgi:hypothetical protein
MIVELLLFLAPAAAATEMATRRQEGGRHSLVFAVGVIESLLTSTSILFDIRASCGATIGHSFVTLALDEAAVFSFVGTPGDTAATSPAILTQTVSELVIVAVELLREVKISDDSSLPPLTVATGAAIAAIEGECLSSAKGVLCAKVCDATFGTGNTDFLDGVADADSNAARSNTDSAVGCGDEDRFSKN